MRHTRGEIRDALRRAARYIWALPPSVPFYLDVMDDKEVEEPSEKWGNRVDLDIPCEVEWQYDAVLRILKIKSTGTREWVQKKEGALRTIIYYCGERTPK